MDAAVSTGGFWGGVRCNFFLEAQGLSKWAMSLWELLPIRRELEDLASVNHYLI